MAPTSLHVELTNCLALHHLICESSDNEPALSLKKKKEKKKNKRKKNKREPGFCFRRTFSRLYIKLLPAI